MGVASSTPEQAISPKQKDIAYLGDRMPFGDDELYHLYDAYQQRKSLASRKQQISFLVDVGVLCFMRTKAGESEMKERKLLIQAMESKILPPNFGNRLYQTSFIGSHDVSDYDISSANGTGEEDEFTHRTKLESFFDGVALCGRRGATKTLQVLVKACKQHESPPENGAVSSPFETAAKQATLIDPIELISMGYRVALASAFLSASAKQDGQEDVGQFLPPEKVSDHPGLISLATSLRAFATKRKQRIEREALPPSKLLELVSAEDVAEWGEQMVPMFAAPVSSLMHQLFFPHRPPPSTRSSFEFPRISSESTFFDGPASPLLFSFSCMSPSLSGEVRLLLDHRKCDKKSAKNSVTTCCFPHLLTFFLLFPSPWPYQYYRLYTSASDGLSFNRLQNSLLGYGGPTLLIIRATDETIFGAFT